MNKLFKFFGKVGNNEDMNPSGIGLGLTICNKILYELGSALTVTSKFNYGTTFSFELALKYIEESNNTVLIDTDSIHLEQAQLC